MLGLVCAVCLTRLAALHAPTAALPSAPTVWTAASTSASTWTHDGPPLAGGTVMALNHARFMPQEAPAEGAASVRPSTASMGFPAEAMANGAPFGFPYPAP